MRKAIITSVGINKVGIVAGISKYLADNNISILDFSQSIKDEIYNMMVIVNVENVADYDQFVSGLKETAGNLGIVVNCQLAEIFEAMHRI